MSDNLVIKLRATMRGEHVHTNLFMGDDKDHLKLCGRIAADVDTTAKFLALLSMGEMGMPDMFQIYYNDQRVTWDFLVSEKFLEAMGVTESDD